MIVNFKCKIRIQYNHLIGLIVLAFSTTLNAQHNNLKEAYFEKFSVSEGLPSSEIFHVIEDQMGYLWIATDNGLSKYNGDQFKTYNHKNGLKTISVIRLFVQKDSSIVGIDLNDEIFRIKNEKITYLIPKDTLIKYKYEKISYPMSFFEDDEGNYHVGFRNNHLVFNKKGARVHLKKPTQDIHINSFETYENQYFSYFHFPANNRIKDLKIDLFINDKKVQSNLNTDIRLLRSIYTSGYNDVQAAYIGRTMFIVKDGNLIYAQDLSNDIITTTVHKNYIYVGTKNGGVFQYEVSGNSVTLVKHLYKKLSISSILVSKTGNLWMTTLEDGLRVYYKSSASRIYESSPSEKITAFNYKSGLLKIGFENGNIRIFPGEETLNLKSKIYFFKDFKGQPLAASLKETILFDSYKTTSYKTLDINYKYGGFRDFININDSCMLLMDRLTGLSKWNYVQNTYDNTIFYSNTIYAMTSFKNQVYISCIDSLEVIDNKSLKKTQSEPQSEPIFYFFENKNELMGVTKSSIVSISKNSRDIVFNFPTASITAANFSNNLLHTSTTNGLYTWELEENSFKLVGFESISGVQSIQTEDDSLYFATKKAIYSKALSEIDCTPPDVRIPWVLINSSKFPIHTIPIIPNGEVNIQIPIEIILKKKGSPTYRYRINNESNYKYTTDPNIYLSALPFGNYELEVSTTIDGITYSSPKIIKFTVDKPFWLKGPFVVLSILTLGFFIFFIVRLRITRLKRKHKLQETITQLKAEALNSQLNPHLIFNVMNSIQGLVAQGNIEKANIFIAEFSVFLRNCLEYSTIQKIEISEEIEMAKQYFEVEKIRFEDKIKFDLDIDLPKKYQNIKVPPLFLQPLLENGIKHGLMPSKNKDKSITLKVAYENEVISIRVIDNGVGINKDFSLGTGMKNSLERIKIINAKNNIAVESYHNPTIISVRIHP